MARRVGITILGILLVFPAVGWAQRSAGHMGLTVGMAQVDLGGATFATSGLGPALLGRAAIPISIAAQVPILGGPFFGAGRPIATFPRMGFTRTTPTIIGPVDYGFYSPYYGQFPYFAPAPFNSTPIYFSEPSYVTPTVMEAPVVSHNDTYYVDDTSVLNKQVQQLSQEIERLQQVVVESQRPVAQVVPPPTVAPAPTVLVFRDGRQMQVVNYAIMGQTVWVLDQGASIRFSTSELDLSATQQANRAKGIRFPSLK